MDVLERISALKAEMKAIGDHLDTIKSLTDGFPEEVTPSLAVIFISRGEIAKGVSNIVMGHPLDIANILNGITDKHETLMPLMAACKERNEIIRRRKEETMEELGGLSGLDNLGSRIGIVLDLLKKAKQGDGSGTDEQKAPVDKAEDKSDSTSTATEE